MRSAAGVVLAGIVIASLLAVPAQALTKTNTKGDVSDKDMEQFGGYTFKGSTRPSRRGQVVVFHFRRVGTNNWRGFKTGPADGRNAFFILDHNRPRDLIKNHRWKVFLTPGVRPGRWVLRAKFLRQDGLASSNVKRWVRVRGSD
ncbi:MAG: hypothetical protein ACRDJ2_07200 [Actinomycetota bacterium]